MATLPRRPPRWSKKTDELVRHVAVRCRPRLQSELGRWVDNSSRFQAFVAAHQDKIRKKLSTADDEEARLGVRAELLVAYLVLADRRFEVLFEAYGARRLGPDLTVTYRTNQRFNLEVTRVRASADADHGDLGRHVARLASVIAGKLRQLPGDVPNALVITSRALALNEDSLLAAARLLKIHSDGMDDLFFARHGLKSAREFHAQLLHLSGVFVVDEASVGGSAIFSTNREARHPLSRDIVAGLSACLAHAGGASG